jgi:hypothetical protein
MLAEWIARLRPSSPAPAWPQLAGTVKADSVLLGPVMLRNLAATLRILPSGTEITGLEASLLGGAMHGYGTLRIAGTDQDKPTYSLEAQFEKLSPPMVGLLLGQHWQGGQLDGNGKLDLSGFTAKELASTAKGALHFDWRRGSVGPVAAGGPLPAALAHFDAWTAETKIANGAVTLEQNEIRRGGRTATVEGSATVGGSSKVSFAMPK